MFNNFLKAIQNDIGGALKNKRPTVVTNVMSGNKWNQNLPKFGGQAQAFQPKPVALPNGKVLNATATPSPIKTKQAPVDTKTQVLGMRVTKSPPITTSAPIQNPRVATPTPTPDPRTSWNNFAEMVIREGNKRGYDGEVLAKQKALESAFGQSKFAKERYNYGGMGAYDADPNQAFAYDSPEQYLYGKGKRGETSYFDLIEKDPRYKEAYAKRKSAKEYLKALKKAGYASDPDYVNKVLGVNHWNNNY